MTEHNEAVPAPFSSLGLTDALMTAIQSSGYTTPTPVQARTIPHLLEGRDVVGQAQTGSGKTGAFAIPLLQRLDLSQKTPQVLVLVPTRELAIQVTAAFERYAAAMPEFQAVAVYGGASYQPQFRQLRNGVHVVVGTPGRVMDHMNRGSMNLQGLRCIVLDEADEMLRMGFAESVEWVLGQLPPERQIALFSATMPEPIRRIAHQYLRNPAEITIQQKAATADTIRQRYAVVAPWQKEAALVRLLEVEPIEGAIVFVKLRSTTEPLAELLSSRGIRAAALNGDLAQAQRERIIENLKSGRLDVVVATDVAARGLDVQRISHVINYDLPGDSESYVHRIGRTGRAGRSGEAILFIHPRGRRILRNLEYATRQQIERMDLPTNRVINKHRIARFHQQIVDVMTDPLMESMRSIMEHFRKEHPELSAEEVAVAVGVLATGRQALLTKEEFQQLDFDEPGRRNDRSRGSRPDRYQGSDRPERRRREFSGGEGADNPPPFGERSERSERGPGRRDRDAGPESGMETFRIEVGHNDQVKPGNIVGAIANEAGIDSARIGRIRILDDCSFVDLPEGMPNDIFQTLRRVWVAGRQLQISRAGGRRERGGPMDQDGRGERRGPGRRSGPGGREHRSEHGGRSRFKGKSPKSGHGRGKPERAARTQEAP